MRKKTLSTPSFRLKVLAATLLVVCLVGASLVGCRQPAGHKKPDLSREGIGVLSVSVPGGVSGSGLAADLQSATDYYEVFVYDSDLSVAETISLTPSEPAAQLSLAEGSYGVCVLAGVKDGSAAALTAGSRNSGDVTITTDNVTEVTLTLSPVTQTVTLPTQVEAGDQLTVSLTADSGSDFLHPLLTGSSTAERPYLIDAEGRTVDAASLTGDLQRSWTAEFTLSAPTAIGTTQLELRGPRVMLHDTDFNLDNASPQSLGGTDWRWLTAMAIEPGEPLEDTVYFNYEVIPVSTGLGVTVSW